MYVSLDQAIEIHARALVYRHERNAVKSARDLAELLGGAGDTEGRDVWLRVASVVSELLSATSKPAKGVPAR